MKEWILLLCVVATCFAEKDDFFATAPKELRPGVPYHINIAYPSSTAVKTVQANIRKQNDEGSELAFSGASDSATILANTGQSTGKITIQVPTTLIPETKFYLFLSAGGVTQPSKELVVATRPNLIFVQTDRGIYKPSTAHEDIKVMLRVLRVNDELKPVVGDNLRLEIKDPKDDTIWLKKDFENDQGIAEAEWSVPKDPVYGTYIALAEGDWGKANTTFDVQEYKLPKMEVQCTLDKNYVVDPLYFGEPSGDVTITGSCKAVYTYGAYVKGSMKIKAMNVGSPEPNQAFENFDGEEPFSLTIPRTTQGQHNQIEVFAEMTEQFTEDKANTTVTFSVYDSEYRALVIKPIPNTLEGDADYVFFAQLLDASGQRVQNTQNFKWFVRAELKYDYPEQTMTETFEGSLSSNPVEITLPSGSVKGLRNAYYSEITVMFKEMDGNTVHESLPETFTPIKYESNTKQALFINIVDRNTEKEISNTETYQYDSSEVCFKVRLAGTESIGSVFYQVISTTYPDELNKTTGPITCVPVTQHMAPKAMLIAYTVVGKDGSKEVLAASLAFDVEWKSPHKVSITITPEEARPNENVNIRIKTEGQALVGLDGIDKSILLLAEVKSLTETRIKQKLGENRMFGKNDKEDSNYPGPMPLFRSWIPYPSGPESTSTGEKLQDAGLLVISNAQIYGSSAGGAVEEDNKAQQSSGGENESKPPQQSSLRKDFPETWLFDVITTNANGEFDLQKKCPGTITTFLVNGYAMNNAKGLGVAEQAQVKCFQPFFVRANLPYSMKKGEETDFQTLVFNYYNEPISVRVSLKEDPAIFSTTGPTSKVVTVQPGSSAEFKVPIKPKKIGVHEVEVSGVWTAQGITDKIIKLLRIEPPGKEIRVYKEEQVDVKQGETTSTLFHLEEFIEEGLEYIVPESLKVELLITGDSVGPFISNLEGNMPMPTGCGEQNMITVIPSVYMYPYLVAIGRTNVDIKEKVAKYCAKGYAKELVYKHDDGSYSAFGQSEGLCGCMAQDEKPKKSGSSWLTAFVLYVFSEMGAQELTYVDHNTLHQSFVFLRDTYDSRSGQFNIVGDVIHQEMKGGTDGGISFTAYVLLAMTNYKKFLANSTTATQQQRQEVQDILNAGVQNLKANTGKLTTKFQMAIVAMFLARNGEYDAARALLSRAETAEMVLKCPKRHYGTPEDVLPCYRVKDKNEPECSVSDKNSCPLGLVCCKTDCQGSTMHCVEGQGPSLVETRGYLALAYLALDDHDSHLDKIKPHYDWLLANRKGSAYDNTQDTAVALQALAEYGLKFGDKAVADFTVTVPANSPVTSQASVVVNKDNYEIQQRQLLDVQWTSDIKSKVIQANVVGSCCKAFVTLSVSYHSTNERQVPKVIDLTVSAAKPVNGTTTQIKIGWRGNRPILESDPKISNMVVVDTKLQSGMILKEDAIDLRALEGAGVTKIETDNGKVVLYFEPEEKKKYGVDNIVYLPVEMEIEVRNQVDGKVEVYDYYARSESVQEAFYATEACYENCGPPTTQGPTTGASSIYISGLLLVCALLATLALFRRE